MPPHSDLDARRGWRIVFVLVHVAFMIMNVAALVFTARERAITVPINWEVPSEQFDQILLMDMWGTCGRLGLLAIGIYLTALIARGDKRVPKYYMWYGIAFLAFEAVLDLAELALWVFPHGTTIVSYALRVTVYTAMVRWVVYVSRSRKVRATFSHEPRAMGPVDRLLIGLVAVALISWPFILNELVEPMTYLAWRVNPKDSTAASGLAQGALLISVATGLFVLMKNAWDMRNVWIALLLPACFATLFYAFVLRGFTLYYRF